MKIWSKCKTEYRDDVDSCVDCDTPLERGAEPARQPGQRPSVAQETLSENQKANPPTGGMILMFIGWGIVGLLAILFPHWAFRWAPPIQGNTAFNMSMSLVSMILAIGILLPFQIVIFGRAFEAVFQYSKEDIITIIKQRAKVRCSQFLCGMVLGLTLYMWKGPTMSEYGAAFPIVYLFFIWTYLVLLIKGKEFNIHFLQNTPGFLVRLYFLMLFMLSLYNLIYAPLVIIIILVVSAVLNRVVRSHI